MSNSNGKRFIEQKDTTRTLVLAALMTVLVYAGTSIIKIPTPTQGYVHPGDGFVLLSSLLLGPVWGTLAAGMGSGLADLLGGYLIYAPATFAIKALTALVGYYVFLITDKVLNTKRNIPQLVISGVTGELVMVAGYFFFEIFMLSVVNGSSLYAGFMTALVGIIPNIVQGIIGVVFSTTLYNLFKNSRIFN